MTDLNLLKELFPEYHFAEITNSCDTIEKYENWIELVKQKPNYIFVIKRTDKTEEVFECLCDMINNNNIDTFFLNKDNYVYVSSTGNPNYKHIIKKGLISPSDNDECPICTNEFDQNKDHSICLYCGEKICVKCIENIIKNRKKIEYECPFCKTESNISEFIK
jgi:hypothetical protein